MEDAGLLLQEWIKGVEGGNALADSAQVREVTKNQEEEPANSDWFPTVSRTQTSTWRGELLEEDATQVLSETPDSWTKIHKYF